MGIFFGNRIKRLLAKRGYFHVDSDNEFTRHGEYARNIQYVFSKEFRNSHTKVIDLIFLGVDVLEEKMVIGFFRENVSIQNGVLFDLNASIELNKFSIEEFEKTLDQLILQKVEIGSDGPF